MQAITCLDFSCVFTKGRVVENGYFLQSEHRKIPFFLVNELSLAVALNVAENIIYHFRHGGERHPTWLSCLKYRSPLSDSRFAFKHPF